MKKFTIYKITNLLDNRIYIGAHITENLEDTYMGSSRYLKKDIKTFGKAYFKKEILFVFNNKQDMRCKEAEIVTKEFCMRTDTYNRYPGGADAFASAGMVQCKDKDGNFILVYKDDPRYVLGELVHHTTGTVQVIDSDGKIFRVPMDDKRYLNGELKGHTVGKVAVKDKNGKQFSVSKDDVRLKSGELVGCAKGFKHQVKHWEGRSHYEETKQKMRKSKNIGESNSQYGTCWITNDIENKKIKKEDLKNYLDLGWKGGRNLVCKK